MTEYFLGQCAQLHQALIDRNIPVLEIDERFEFLRTVRTSHGEFVLTIIIWPSYDEEIPWRAGFKTPPINMLGKVGYLIDEGQDSEEGVECFLWSEDATACAVWLAEIFMDTADLDVVSSDLADVFKELTAAHYERGGSFYREWQGPNEAIYEAQGFDLILAIDRAYGKYVSNLADYSFGLDRLAVAAEVFDNAGLEWHRLLMLLTLADALQLSGDVVGAKRLMEDMAPELRVSGFDDLRAMGLAQQFGVEADYARSLDLINEAIEIGESIDHKDVPAWIVERDVVVGATGETAAGLKALRARLLDTPEEDVGTWTQRAADLGYQLVNTGSRNEGIGLLREAVRKAKAAGLARYPDIGLRLAQALIQVKQFDEARSLLDEHEPMITAGDPLTLSIARSLRVTLSDLEPDQIDEGSGYHALTHKGLALIKQWRSDEALECFQQVHRLAEAAGDNFTQALNRANIVIAKLARAAFWDTEAQIAVACEAIEDLVPAIKLAEKIQHSLTTSDARQGWATNSSDLYEVALRMCAMTGDHFLALELIERMKAQGIPDLQERKSPEIGDSPSEHSAGLLAALNSHSEVIEPPDHFSVSGRSQLASEGDSVTRIEDLARSQAGSDAWLWTIWAGGMGTYWAVFAPTGQVDAGRIDRSAEFENGLTNTELEEVLANLSSPDVALKGIFGEDRSTFERLFASLGAALVPDLLAKAAAAASEDAPIRIVYSPASSMSWLPVGLLEVQTEQEEKSFRLIERAVIQLASPYIHPRERKMTAQTSVGSISVIDPTNELVFVEDLVEDAELLMAGEVMTHLDQRIAAATRQNFLDLLAQPASAEIPVLLFAGHACGAKRTDPLSSGLVFDRTRSESSRVTVRDLVKAADSLYPPRSVVLCACSSIIDDVNDHRERWGLGIGFLLAGADAVAGSTWDLLDSPTTSNFAKRLRKEFRDPLADYPLIVRNVQLELMRMWEQALVEEDKVGAAELYPHYWAPWIVMTSSSPR